MGSNDICMIPYTGIYGDNGNAVIHIDSDDDDDGVDENETRKVVMVPLPFDVNPTPYDDDDIAWAVDRSCPVPDAFGCFMP
mmetsp:Transcript_12251/g.18500  ORF Transcript_12251/g.18500 Transcript_12251/m.18500 type:complete len:81 (+) Transcript_12251:2-244(+)